MRTQRSVHPNPAPLSVVVVAPAGISPFHLSVPMMIFDLQPDDRLHTAKQVDAGTK
ncbi:hypothetical protein [Xanthomonas campestris]|jgi:hypothetical protein|uniref:hypothetical protein n=1 Tax=Xanthomonas campestris TaxID=339 RepID=UPI00216268E3|nr:hypothetical protein [Xanthomonas campestris]MEA9491211.1 hypothetical protein [Xanthomonas campestris]MEA9509774.1 hypothetical protein [Xanthomonas campestris]MEA9576131.1 hypothetical protein [Xanthomonas campestris]MEB2111663.1 hypothetical protein [Xanthomonas campestris pv. campestris]